MGVSEAEGVDRVSCRAAICEGVCALATTGQFGRTVRARNAAK